MSHTRRSDAICASVMRLKFLLYNGSQPILILHFPSCSNKSYHYSQHRCCPHHYEPPAKSSCLRSTTGNMPAWYCCICSLIYNRSTNNFAKATECEYCQHPRCKNCPTSTVYSVLYAGEAEERGERVANEQDGALAEETWGWGSARSLNTGSIHNGAV